MSTTLLIIYCNVLHSPIFSFESRMLREPVINAAKLFIELLINVNRIVITDLFGRPYMNRPGLRLGTLATHSSGLQVKMLNGPGELKII